MRNEVTAGLLKKKFEGFASDSKGSKSGSSVGASLYSMVQGAVQSGFISKEFLMQTVGVSSESNLSGKIRGLKLRDARSLARAVAAEIK